jgi:hypothetical protein
MIRSIFAALLLGATTAALPAQTRPDFSGTWMMDQQRSDAAVQETPSGSVTLVITQTDRSLVVEMTRQGQRTFRIESAIADSERASPPMVGAPAARSYWNGASLVTEATRNISGQTVRTKEVRSLDAAGREMTVITTLIVEHGYTLQGGRNYGVGKDVYVKVSP